MEDDVPMKLNYITLMGFCMQLYTFSLQKIHSLHGGNNYVYSTLHGKIKSADRHCKLDTSTPYFVTSAH